MLNCRLSFPNIDSIFCFTGLKDDLEEAAKEKQKQMKLGKMTPFEQYKQKRKEKQRLKEREKRQVRPQFAMSFFFLNI